MVVNWIWLALMFGYEGIFWDKNKNGIVMWGNLNEFKSMFGGNLFKQTCMMFE